MRPLRRSDPPARSAAAYPRAGCCLCRPRRPPHRSETVPPRPSVRASSRRGRSVRNRQNRARAPPALHRTEHRERRTRGSRLRTCGQNKTGAPARLPFWKGRRTRLTCGLRGAGPGRGTGTERSPPAVVPVAGVEPARVISPTDFESVTSANSITPANLTQYTAAAVRLQAKRRGGAGGRAAPRRTPRPFSPQDWLPLGEAVAAGD